jgi:hypothetical protein
LLKNNILQRFESEKIKERQNSVLKMNDFQCKNVRTSQTPFKIKSSALATTNVFNENVLFFGENAKFTRLKFPKF